MDVDSTALQQFARAIKGADKDLRRAFSKAIREAAKPLGAQVLREGSASMPARGGLRARLLAGKVSIRSSLTGSNPKVMITLANREKDALGALDQGSMRHPVFARGGRPRRWTSQRVPSGTYAASFERNAPDVRGEVQKAVQSALDDIARKA